ncbi:LLGL2 domain-containing protein [Ditylenchus destructor]|uniref:LLGL2 domain-containing protein n=1 Tax=Ditylenchus destructor TaxID=166010 RepID=A0AAD4NE97_9BILA|nr:LLGL2 domain-containing protein [Ditylenchus destructor]
MLRFIRSHITNSSDQKTEDLTDFFSYSKVATYGFPQKVSCLCLDETLGLLAIGTKDGTLRIVGAEGVEWSIVIESGLPIVRIYFAVGSGVLIALCDDVRSRMQSFYRCQILNERIVLTRFQQGKNINRISCCEMLNRSDGNSALLIGTEIGNIYALWVQNLELVDYLIFSDATLRECDALNGKGKTINRIIVHPEDNSKLFILFDNKVVLLYDTLEDNIDKVFSPASAITDICVSNYSTLLCAGIDGSYTIFSFRESDDEPKSSKIPFGPFDCTAIPKILCAKITKYNDDIILFTGGMPNASYGDRYTLTISLLNKLVVLDFESAVLDFAILQDEGSAPALFVLCQEELVVIDLMVPSFPMFRLPHFNPIHSSPVTFMTISLNLSDTAISRLYQINQEQLKRSEYSSRSWPLKCGSRFARQNNLDELPGKETSLLVTGHENGSVNIWLTNSLGFTPWITINTATEFDGFDDNDGVEDNEREDYGEKWPPFKRVGLFDSCCDDYRLSILKLDIDADTADLAVGGGAGQFFVYEASSSSTAHEPPTCITVDMTEGALQSSTNRGVRNNTISLMPRSRTKSSSGIYKLVLNTILQFKPVTLVSAVAWHSKRQLIATGNEFGYCVVCLKRGQILAKSNLISSMEIVQISSLDGTLSRFKSVKKSIRQSFRRKKKPTTENNIENSPAAIEDYRPTEREIIQRSSNPNVLGGETPNSLVKAIQFSRCALCSHASPLRDYVLFGTHGGVVLIHHLVDSDSENNKCPLVKEIRLQHHAPIVGMEFVQDILSTKLLIFTEEQVRCFLLPGLKPSRYKCRFTATEGSRIKKANTVLLRNVKSKRSTNYERFISLITTRGEVYLISLATPRRNLHIPFTRVSDAVGISSATLSLYGEMFYLKDPSSRFIRINLYDIRYSYKIQLL